MLDLPTNCKNPLVALKKPLVAFKNTILEPKGEGA